MEMSLQQWHKIEKGVKKLWHQPNETHKFNMKLIISSLQDDISAVKLRDCKNVHKCTSQMQGYLNGMFLGMESSTATIPTGEYSNSISKCTSKNDNWRVLIKWMYNIFDTLANQQDNIVTMIKAYKV